MPMRRRLACLAVVLFAASPSPLLAQTHPNFSGTWKLNEANRKPEDRGPRGVVYKIEHADPAFKYEASGRQANYAAFSEAYAFTTDGKLPEGDAAVKVVGQWDGPVLVTRYIVKGEETFVVRYSLSPDGKQMTRDMEMKGKPLSHDLYDKQ